MPDFGGILPDGPIGGELAGGSDVHQALPGEGFRMLSAVRDGGQLRLQIGGEILQDEVMVRGMPAGALQDGGFQLRQGAFLPGGDGLVLREGAVIQGIQRLFQGAILPINGLWIVGGLQGIQLGHGGAEDIFVLPAGLLGDLHIGADKKVLYVTGEESSRQIRMRAERLNALADELYICAENNLERIIKHVENVQPELLIVDSIQTIYKSDIESAPGSVSQVRECSASLMRLAKNHGVTTFIIGHVTKDGNLAGPRVLEHIVDTVLFFEGERTADFRVLRAIKNRFGATSEIGLFEMRDSGLVDVPDASKLFLPDKAEEIGSVIVPTVEGTRPLLVEIQALVAPTPFMPPRRTSDSVDIKRIQLLLAVLEKRLHLSIGSCDVYVKTAGGIKIDEPATDLPIAISLASSFANRKLLSQCAIFGEVGLSGEIRAVSKSKQRVDESIRMGFTNIILPKKNFAEVSKIKSLAGINLISVENLRDALKIAMPREK